MAKKIAIGFAICVGLIVVGVISISLLSNDPKALNIGGFVVLALTLIVLVWYAYDTNTIARVTTERWMREGGVSASYNMGLADQQGGAGHTIFQVHNPSALLLWAKVNCNFKLYGQPVEGDAPYSGKESWLIYPHQISQGWFEVDSLLQKKGKTVATMIAECNEANRREQFTMNLELEFWDELKARRHLPARPHYFDFKRWAWIPQLTEREKS